MKIYLLTVLALSAPAPSPLYECQVFVACAYCTNDNGKAYLSGSDNPIKLVNSPAKTVLFLQNSVKNVTHDFRLDKVKVKSSGTVYEASTNLIIKANSNSDFVPHVFKAKATNNDRSPLKITVFKQCRPVLRLPGGGSQKP